MPNRISIKWSCLDGHAHETEEEAHACILQRRRLTSLAVIDVLIMRSKEKGLKIGEIWVSSAFLIWLAEYSDLNTHVYIDPTKGLQTSNVPYYHDVMMVMREIVPIHDAWLICQEAFIILPADRVSRIGLWEERTAWAIDAGGN